IRGKLQNIEKIIQTLSDEEKNILQRIEAYNEKISLTKKYLKKLQLAINTKTAELRKLEEKIQNTIKNIESHRKNIDKILVAYYKMQQILPLELMSLENSYARTYQKFVYLRLIANDQRNSIIKLASLKKSFELQKAEATKIKFELENLKAQKQKEEKNLIELQATEKKMLLKITQEKKQKTQLAQELKIAAERLEKLIKELEAKRQARKSLPGTHYLEIMKGRLPWPCSGDIVSYFGSYEDPKYKTKIKNNGIDIRCGSDCPVKAVAPGKVAFAARFMGYGNMVILDHGEGYYTVYSNLSEINCAVDEKLETGDILGRSQDILHFEFRAEGKAVDPLLWLSR
ncbi:MAG: peptidoglycan DD-metalloendopeptidase family protein, partial [candidate division WOR-3 bacterium]|nr:peptidoglycan DD-metalloendopeptidase family protein [candidate division WOR-3 bacterium]